MTAAKPKVLLLVTLSERGGAQHVVYQMASHLSERYDVTVGCGPGDALVEDLQSEGIRAIEFPTITRYVHPIRDPWAFVKIYRWLRRERFDIVHCHSTKAGLLGRIAAWMAKVPIIVFTAHGWAFAEGRALWKRWVIALAERMVARISTRIICVSRYDKQLALQFRVAREDQMTVIHNGIDPTPFMNASDVRVREELELASGPTLTFVGRLVHQKNPFALLQAMRTVDHGRLLVVGSGPYGARMHTYVQHHGLEGRVVMTGQREDIPELLSASDLFVLPSRWEGLPLTIIEAMMAGLPVITTDVGGNPELVEHGVNGLLVPPNDVEALASAIRRLSHDESLCKQMGEAGQAKAMEMFGHTRMLTAVETLYGDLCHEADADVNTAHT
ncbi:MAG: glycosyltransferase family 4 protein [Salinibacter sp.]